MNAYDQTSMGGTRQAFLTTHWSLIGEIHEGQDRDRALIGLLMERYWKPVYCFLRHKGHDNEQAKDLTQGFFHEVVLNRDLVRRADPARGRFRTLLLHALTQYLIDQKRKGWAQKRISPDQVMYLDMSDPQSLPELIAESEPQQSFDYTWKVELLERVIDEVKQYYIKRQMHTHWALFQERLLDPILSGDKPPSFKLLADQYRLTDQIQASNMFKTVKRLFRSVLKKQVRQTVVSSELVEDELGDMFRFIDK
jgi:RNA polymerase sigma-70 factor (ECF subfamily)